MELAVMVRVEIETAGKATEVWHSSHSPDSNSLEKAPTGRNLK
jgi:hypothetical protein